jgi:hypothetical protein
MRFCASPGRSAYDMAAIMFRGWDAETNNSPEVRHCSCRRRSRVVCALMRMCARQCYRDDAVLAHHMQHDTTEQYIQARWRTHAALQCATRLAPR